MKAGKSRAILSKEQVIQIFKLRSDYKQTAPNVAKDYCVSEKTIRDIWKGRTWAKETLKKSFSSRPPGRPPGSKNKNPRKKSPKASGRSNMVTEFVERPGSHSIDAQLHDWDQGIACLEYRKDPFWTEWSPCCPKMALLPN